MGMELLATIDWLIHEEGRRPTLEDIRDGIDNWPAGAASAARKQGMFSDRQIELALRRVQSSGLYTM